MRVILFHQTNFDWIQKGNLGRFNTVQLYIERIWEVCSGPQKETPCFDPDNETTLLRVILTMTFQNNHVRFYVSPIVSGEGRHTTYLLKCVRLLSTSQTDWRQSSNILSDISFDSLSDILSGILSDILFGISFDILSDTSSDILSDISPHIIAVEVRHGTLNSQDRGWGPGPNTELTGSQLGTRRTRRRRRRRRRRLT